VIPDRCPETIVKLPGVSFNAHKSLVFENIMFTAWSGGGLRAIDISNPGTPFEAGVYFPKPVPTTQTAPNPELALFSHPIMKNGYIYVLDTNSGVYTFRYTGPRNEELPARGLFTPNAMQVPGRVP
jgi:hypothetical protein